ncbi:MAG: SAM-dependent methyltransferase [Alphaproteobacteria bacterium]|nr:SAM-dependent methyltransferase [Alphaproteobacteria bacterium]
MPMDQNQPAPVPTDAPSGMAQYMRTIDERREAIALATPAKRKAELGQFMTPGVIATFMAGMFTPLRKKKIRLLDAGAGIGSLTAAFADRAAREEAASLQCEAWEIDSQLHEPLQDTLDACAGAMRAAGGKFESAIQPGDFIVSFSGLFAPDKMASPTHAILNPPYRKIHSASAHRQALRNYGVETANLYSAFVALALKALADEGKLVAITPRSFCNGTYFRPFRELLLHKTALVQIHLFESRVHAFKADEVLQENVIFHLVKGQSQGLVTLSSSCDATFSEVSSKTIPFEEIVSPTDKEKIFHLVPGEDSAATIKGMSRYSNKLENIGLGVSTGPVVDFRLRDHLRAVPGEGIAPMVYAHHFDGGFVAHPKLDAKKPNYIALNDETNKWMMPTGFYVCVRRLSSKEEKRRIVPAVFDPAKVAGPIIGFDNHINVFHQAKKGMPKEIAKGLAVYLGSTFADRWLRRFSGHTQVNAGDLRAMRYPDLATLKEWGEKVGDNLPTQEKIDQIVGGIDEQD